MFENIISFFKKMGRKDALEEKSKDTAKERLQLVLTQDRANVSADFLDMMRQEIIDIIKKYIDVDENQIDVKLTNRTNEDGTIGAPALYANIPIAGIKEHLVKKEEPKAGENKEEKVEEVTIDDFAKLQFKVGTIVKCEPHPKADRLLVEQIDLGGEVRQIVSGIAKHYKPEELIGKQVVVVTNLKPVKLRGVESYGMILCATDDKDLSFVTVAKEMPNGVTVR